MLVIGVDGVRFDRLGPEATPRIRPGAPPPVTRQTQVAPLVLAALGDITWR